jgi:histone-lysine N-methyltransferase SETMAR
MDFICNVETKEHSKQWLRTHSTNKPKSLNKCCLPARRMMVTVFCDRKGVVVVEFMQHGATITSQVYSKTLKNCAGPAVQKRRGMLTSGVKCFSMTLSVRIKLFALERCWGISNWELSDSPAYSPDIAPSDYRLFTYMKNWLPSQRFKNNEE